MIYKNEFQPCILQSGPTRGGVSMMCTPRFHSKYLEQGSDQDLGRWMWMRFKGNDNYNLVVLTANQQVSQKTHAGLGIGDGIYAAIVEKTCNPRSQFWVNLSHQIQL